MHRPASAEGLVVSIWVDSRSPQELSVVRDDADVGSGDEESDLAVLVRVADRDVAQPTEVAQCDSSESVDLVAANAVVGGRGLLSRSGLDERVEDGDWCLPVECSVWPATVVVVAKGIKLKLQFGQGACWRLLA